MQLGCPDGCSDNTRRVAWYESIRNQRRCTPRQGQYWEFGEVQVKSELVK